MKRMIHSLLVALLITNLVACGGEQNVRTWQEQYDLGVRYLSEGKYEDAIIAFTAAIEIDSNQALAYVGRGQSYMLSEDADTNLAAAQSDFEAALNLDDTIVDAWLGLADIFIHQGDFDRALEVLQQAKEVVGENGMLDQRIQDVLMNYTPINYYGVTEFIYRPEYIGWSELDSEAQCLVINAAEMVMAGNHEAFLSFVEKDIPDTHFLTIWNDYKVKIDVLIQPLPDSNTNLSMVKKDISIELRPQNGTGFYLTLTSEKGSNVDTYSESYVAGNCDDWVWNGNYQRTISQKKTGQFVWPTGETAINVYDYESNEHGSVVLGQPDGEIVVDWHSSELSDPPMYTDYDREGQDLWIYDNGKCIKIADGWTSSGISVFKTDDEDLYW